MLQNLLSSFVFWSAWIIIPIVVEIIPSIGCASMLIKRRLSGRKTLPDPKLWPEITLIIPVYNSEDTLHDCIRSVNESTYPNKSIRIFLANNGSSDRSFEVFSRCQQEYADLHMQWLEAQQGKARALNLAIYNSASEYIINIDSDGQLDPDALANLVKKFEANHEVNCMSGSILTDPQAIQRYANPLSRLFRKLEFMEYAQAFLAGRSYAAELNAVYTLSGAFTAFRKSALLESRMYNTNTISEDTHLTFQMRYLSNERIEMCDDALFFVDPIEGVDKLYTQRQRWQRGSLEVARLFPVSRLKPSRFAKDVNIYTLMFDHTFAFPRLIWYIALFCLMAMNVSAKTIALSVLLIFALYIIVGYLYYFCVLALLKMKPDLRRYYVRQWWVVLLLPFFNLAVFFIRVAGIINSIGTPSSWKTRTLTQEGTAFRQAAKDELAHARDVLSKPRKWTTDASRTTERPPKPNRRIVWYVGVGLVYLLSVIVIAACIWYNSTFDVSLNEIVATLLGPLGGTGGNMVQEGIVASAVPAAVALTIVVTLSVILYRCGRQVKCSQKQGSNVNAKASMLSCVHQAIACGALIAFIGACAFANSSFGIADYIVNSQKSTQIYEDYYVDPQSVAISSDADQPRNLIYIYSESLEITYSSVEEGGIHPENYLPNLTALAHENVSFGDYSDKLSGFHSLPKTNWTMAGIFSTTSGIPFATPVSDAEVAESGSYFSGVTSLGDILEEKGYTQEFICGSDAEFGGRAQYFQTHGNYKIFDVYSAKEAGYIPQDYWHWWGYEDFVLFDIAKDEVTSLAESGQPFNLTLLTVDPHPSEGYICEQCDDAYDVKTANVVACQDRQIAEFIEWCKQQDFYENTTIIVTGDHPRMDEPLVGDTAYYDRAVYNCFINSAAELSSRGQTRIATPFDIMPSTLASLGFTIEGNRLGLGANLFSDEPTLAETRGFEWIEGEMEKNSDYFIDRFIPELRGYDPTGEANVENTEGAEPTAPHSNATSSSALYGSGSSGTGNASGGEAAFDANGKGSENDKEAERE